MTATAPFVVSLAEVMVGPTGALLKAIDLAPRHRRRWRAG